MCEEFGDLLKRIPLDLLQGNKFREAAIDYIKPLLAFISKGSIFISDLSPLYGHPRKADILEQPIFELEHSIRTDGRYPDRTVKEPLQHFYGFYSFWLSIMTEEDNMTLLFKN
ncbi:N-terminal acetyltransferase A complex auxiliary subunit NAA15-like [Durio zibethinus]|uniref:N-terminal acetyltransferase A complex auxiliary subunit NAA15-like n=1 Tax=Durio zibethinus TaxID=66656 RepID=A0A6P5ZHK4_DURZI|nr:N-terminal acetyltransferase A complex auxiliary subunit NAA15-like [Durio zibethinus]